MITGTPLMAFWKQREAVVIVADLKRWYLNDISTVTGIIYRSIKPKEYLEGDRYTFMNMQIEAYPFTMEYGVGHFIATSPTGISFRLNATDHL